MLPADGQLLLLSHYVNYCQTTILCLQTEMGNLVHELAHDSNPGYLQSVLDVMQHVTRQWEAERDWIAAIHARALAEYDVLGTQSADDMRHSEGR